MKGLWVASVACAGVLVLSACGKERVIPPLPQGVQTISGTVQSAELSLVRRGTHKLMISGQIAFYLESSSVNLRSYEGKDATLRGVLTHNTDPIDVPVLIVESVADVQERDREWEFLSLGIRLRAPLEWTSLAEGSTVRFVDAEGASPIITLFEEPGSELPDGVSIVVDGKPAVRTIDETTGRQTVSVQRPGNVIVTMVFTPRSDADSDVQRTQWLDVLHSITIGSSSSSTSSRMRGTGSTLVPCGGAAGILCPQGSYCEILNVSDTVGMCRSL